MKKLAMLLCLGILSVWGAIPVFADPVVTGLPTPPPSNSATVSIGDQLSLGLLQHVTAVAERSTDGRDRMEFLDSLAEIGQYKGDYILALDAGFLDSTSPDSFGNYKMTFGAHLHVIQSLVTIGNISVSPSMQTLLNDLDLCPRWSYDTDVSHGVFGVTFGAVIPFQ